MLSSQKYVKMQATIVYAISIASVVGFVLVLRLAQLLTFHARERLFSTFSKWVLYTLVWPRAKGSSDVSILAAAAITLFLVGNIIGSVLAIRGRAELSLRLARLCTMNMTILFLGGRTSFILDKMFQLSMIEYYSIHRWVGRISIAEGILHAILNILQFRSTIRNVELSVCFDLQRNFITTDFQTASYCVWCNRLLLLRIRSPPHLRDLPWGAFAGRDSPARTSTVTFECQEYIPYILSLGRGRYASASESFMVRFPSLPERRVRSVLSGIHHAISWVPRHQ